VRYLIQTFTKSIDPSWNLSVISITILLSLLLSIFVLIDPVYSSNALSNLYSFLSYKFEYVFMYGSFGLLIFLFLLASSRYGRIQIKLDNKPEYSIFSWGSMLFAAGIGATVLYWSTVEWIDYYNILKSDSNNIDSDALIYARTYPVFRWGLLHGQYTVFQLLHLALH